MSAIRALVSASALVLALGLRVPPARAQPPPPAAPATPAPPPARASSVLVVDVAPGEPELDATTLRAAIGRELGMQAVAPDDPGAPHASGTIRVSVDRPAHALVVAYRGEADAIVRRIDLPPDRPSTERAAVLLAGNLARDEGDELAAQLRKGQPDTAAPADATAAAPSSSAAPAVAREATLADGEDAEDERDAARLGDFLAYYRRQSDARATTSVVLMGLGYGALGVGLGADLYGLIGNRSWVGASGVGWYAVQAADALFLGSAMTRPGNFDSIQAKFESERRWGTAWSARHDAEQEWLRVAKVEHGNRRFIGWIATVLGALGTGLSTALLVATLEDPSQASMLGAWIGFDGVLAADFVMGIYMVASDGPVESALHAYEGAMGRTVRAEEPASALRPFVAPVSGGGVVGVGGRF